MAAARRTPGGLAARIVRLILLAGMTTAATAGAVSLVSVSRLASERAAARDLVALQVVEGAIEERLRAASGVLDRAGGFIASAAAPGEVASSVAPVASGSQVMFDEFAVAELAGGRVLFSQSATLTAGRVRTSISYLSALRGASGFESDEHTKELALWGSRTAVTAWGEPVVVIVKLDAGFVRRALDAAVRDQPGRVVILLEGDEIVGSAGSAEELLVRTAEWTQVDQGVGRVRLLTADGAPLAGYYNDIEGAGDVSWRVVAAEPAVADARATFVAVAPSIAVLGAGGLLAALLAWVLTRRLLRPLRDLERTARTAASGAYVKQLPAGSDDEIGRVANAFNQVALRLNALHDLSQLLASASRLDQVLDGILSAMEHIVGPGSAAIYLVDAERGSLVPARTRGATLASVTAVRVTDGGWLAEALGAPGPVTWTGESAGMSAEIPGLACSASGALVAPLVAGHDPLGLVVVLYDDESGITDAELEMVRTFSAQAAVAVQTSRLFEIESESRRIAEALRSVAEQLVRPQSLAAALHSVESTIRELFGALAVHIAVADRTALGIEESPTDEQRALTEVAEVLLEEAADTVVLRHGADPRVDALLDEYDGRDLMVVPIARESGHGGMLVLVLPMRPEVGSVDVAHALVDEIALALENAYFYERAVTRAANLETIFRISQAVASPLQVNVVLNRVLDVVQKILVADAVMLWSYDPRRRALGTAMIRGDVPARMVSLELEPGEDLPGAVFQTAEPVVLRNLTVGMGGVAGSAARQDLRSLLAVPLLARGRPIGVLMVLSQNPSAFTEEDMNMLQTFASQAALAIDTARLYSREHDVAHVLQQSILPEALPDFPEVDTGSVYAPAGGDADIGGDYYDLFRGPEGAIWFAIADVCGKGVQAATKTSMIKYAIRALVAAGLRPAHVVGEVNTMTSDAGDPSDIVTLWIGRYDVRAGSLTWADGGHPPAVLRRADGSVEHLGPTGPLLGARRDVEFDQSEVAFRAGDRVMLYTDGVTEARQGNTFFGDDRLAASLSMDRSAQEDARLLLESVRDFVRAELRDDVAVLVVVARDHDGASGEERVVSG